MEWMELRLAKIFTFSGWASPAQKYGASIQRGCGLPRTGQPLVGLLPRVCCSTVGQGQCPTWASRPHPAYTGSSPRMTAAGWAAQPRARSRGGTPAPQSLASCLRTKQGHFTAMSHENQCDSSRKDPAYSHTFNCSTLDDEATGPRVLPCIPAKFGVSFPVL